MSRGRLRGAAPGALYALVLLASFHPESLHPARTILYVGDPLESAYLMAWHAHQVLRAPLHLFDANYLYPVKGAVATTEHHLLQGLALAPVTWLTGNPILVFNCAVALTGLLDAFAARKLALALAAVGLAGSTRREGGGLLPARLWTPAAAALAVLFVLLSLGRDLTAFGHRFGPGPYRLLYSFVPGLQYLRIPERFGLLAMLFVALLVAQGLTVLEAARLPVAALVLAAIVPIEHLSVATRVAVVPVGDEVPPVYRWLATQPVHAVAEVPTYGEHAFRRETWEMYYSTYHFKPIVHGYTAYPTRESVRLRECAVRVPEEQALDCLESWRVDTLIVHYPPPGTSLRENTALEELVGRPPGNFYRGIAAREAEGSLRRLASFEGPRSRIPGGRDVVFRIARPEAPGP